MYRQCSICRELVPAHLFARHRQAHKNAEPQRQRTRTDEWKRLKLKVKQRDGFRCCVCGITQEQLMARGERLEVHHTRGPSDNRPSSLVTVCPDHNPRGARRSS